MAAATGVPDSWDGLIRDWERALRAENKSPNTIRIYRDAARSLARYVPDTDPADVGRATVRDYLAHVVETTSAGNAHTLFRALQQWFKFLAAEGEIEQNPMLGMKPPIVPEKLVPESAHLALATFPRNR